MAPIILILNGPNLNLLGTREPATYGHETLADLSRLCADTAEALGLAIEFRQTNHEAELIDWIHNCLLYTSPSPRDQRGSRMPSSA